MDIYPWAYIYRKKETVLFWITTSDKDYFLTSKNGKLVSSDSINELKILVEKENYTVHWSDISQMNFDRFWVAIKNLREGKASSTKTCKVLLDGLNFIQDISNTFNLSKQIKGLHTGKFDEIYNKIFAGNNLPSMTPGGKVYHPLWNRDEIQLIKKELKSIWNILITNEYLKEKLYNQSF